MMAHTEQKEAFVFLRGYMDVAAKMPPAAAGVFLLAVSRYMLDGIEPKFTDWGLESAWEGIVRSLDKSRILSEAGRKGGRKSSTKGRCNNPNGRRGGKATPPTAPTAPHVSESSETSTPPTATRTAYANGLIPPTEEEITAELATYSNTYGVTATAFWDYYTAMDWTTNNGQQINCWEAVLKGWISRAKEQWEENGNT